MKKLLLILITIFALSSCNKKEEKIKWDRPQLSPKVSSCMESEGKTMVLKSDIPAEFIVAFFTPENSTEPIKGKELHETDNDIYNITQVDEYTFLIIVKPFIEPSRICFAFVSKENPAARTAFAWPSNPRFASLQAYSSRPQIQLHRLQPQTQA